MGFWKVWELAQTFRDSPSSMALGAEWESLITGLWLGGRRQ